ncbi:hypothetical protein EMCRGX_G031173 [Ephydatia muelleri]
MPNSSATSKETASFLNIRDRLKQARNERTITITSGSRPRLKRSLRVAQEDGARREGNKARLKLYCTGRWGAE